MIEEQAVDQEGSAPPNAEPTVPAGSGPATAATPDPATGTPLPKPTEAAGSEPKGGVEHQKLRQRAQQAETEAAYWRGIAEGRGRPDGQGAPARPIAPAGPPKVEDFQTYDDFVVARAKFEMHQEQAALEGQRQAIRSAEEFQAKLAAAAKTDAEIYRLASDPTLPVSPAMAEAIRQSDQPAQLLRFLDEHRDEAQRLYRMHPLSAVRELGKIEDRLTAKPTPQKLVSQAPEPITPLGTGQTPAGMPDPDDPVAWAAYMNAQEYGR